MKVQFLKHHDHRLGNGVTAFYRQGQHGEFDDGYARALIYEGIATVPAEDEVLPVETRETKIVAPAETKPEPLKLKKK